MITKTNIDNLFDRLWPEMYLAKVHKETCLKNIETINRYFENCKNDHNKLILNLSQIDGIGITIASGLIWSVYPEIRVPFDKYTTSYAIYLEIIPNNKVSKNYEKYSNKIKDYCNEFTIEDRKFEIEDFVREAVTEVNVEILLSVE